MEALPICSRCQEKMNLSRVDFTYLDHTFHTDVPKCPKCGAVFIAQALAEGKMAEVEMLLEDK